MELLLWLFTKIKYRKALIGYKARVKNSQLYGYVRIYRQARIMDSTIDCDSHVGCEAVIRNTTVGKRTGIAERAIVGVYNRKNRRTYIGDDVMIGTGAIIMEGVTIGSGAWIGAGTVIRSNVRAYTVMAGNPAQKIRVRPVDETGQKMG